MALTVDRDKDLAKSILEKHVDSLAQGNAKLRNFLLALRSDIERLTAEVDELRDQLEERKK